MDNFDLMRERLRARGGIVQQARMIKDKKEALKRAIKYSYQGAQVQAIGKSEPAIALINPNTVKQDYDDKIISIDFDYDYSVGTVFEWSNTGTKWLIYLQDLTEIAYFKGDIRKCNYEIKWEDQDDEGKMHKYTTYVALTGPSEKKIESSIKEGISLDSPNYSLHFYMPNNEYTSKYFNRYTKFYLQGLPTCWRIEAIDKISMPGILEIYAYEYYANEHEDNIEEGLVGDLIVEPIEPTKSLGITITGDSFFIKPKTAYTCTLADGMQWENSIFPPEVKIIEKTNNSITLKWDTTRSGQFDLVYENGKDKITQVVVVESLF